MCTVTHVPLNPDADFIIIFCEFALVEVKIDYVPRQGMKISLQPLRVHVPDEGAWSPH